MPLHDGGGAGDNKDRFYYMDVSNMWDMLQYHDSAPHQQALKGWRQSYELVLMHKTQVEKYKEKLITAWPPERSKAARAYVERLDHLIESLHETFEAAIANYSAYSTAIAAVDDAKRKLATIQQEHASNAAALAAHTAELQARPRVYFGKAVPPPAPPSPVADGRQEQLRLQAADLMMGLSAELATAQMSLTAPKPYTPINRMDSSSDTFEPGGNGGIPPVLPSPSARGVGSPRASRSALPIPDTRTGATPNNGRPDERLPARKPSDGPVLGGTKQPLNPPLNTAPTTPTTASPGPGFGGPPHSTTTQGSPSGTLPRNLSSNGSLVGGTPFGATPSASGIRGGSPLHGGIIGATPPIGGPPSGRAGQLNPGARGNAQRINPPGGIIGQGAVSPSGRRPGQQGDQDAKYQRWDPDNPWETENGIDPVLLPPSEKSIKPGPTIGGR